MCITVYLCVHVCAPHQNFAGSNKPSDPSDPINPSNPSNPSSPNNPSNANNCNNPNNINDSNTPTSKRNVKISTVAQERFGGVLELLIHFICLM